MRKIIGFLGDMERRIAYFLLVLLTVLLFVQILNRYLFMTSIAWMEETCRLSFVWLIYFSVAIAAKEGRHIRVNIVDLFLPPLALKAITYLADAFWIAFNLALTYFGILLVKSTFEFEFRAPVTNLHMGIVFFVIPFCFALMAFRVIYFNVLSILKKTPDIPEDRALDPL